MWRGLGLETSLDKGRREAAELAGFRRDCADQRAAYDRARVTLLKSRRSRHPGSNSRSHSLDEFGQPDEGPWVTKERTTGHRISKGSDESMTEALGDTGERSESPRLARNSLVSTLGRTLSNSMTLGASLPTETSLAHPMHEVATVAMAAMRFSKGGAAALEQVPKPGEEGRRMTASIEVAMLMEAGWDMKDGEPPGTLPRPEDLPEAIVPSPQSAPQSHHAKQDVEPSGRRMSGGGRLRRGSTVLAARQRSPNHIQKSITNMSKVRRLLEARKAEFEALPFAERQRLKRAFAIGDVDNKAFLTTEGLRKALCDLGLDARTRQEKAVLNEAFAEVTAFGAVNFFEFVFNTVPKVEHRLQEARSPKLYADFMACDPSGTGRLSQVACLQALRRHACNLSHIDEEIAKNFWKGFEQHFPETFKAHARYGDYGKSEVDFAAFQELAKIFQSERSEFHLLSERRTALDARLPSNVEATHFGELTYLRRIFGKNLRNEVLVLNKVEAFKALIECGAMPVVGDAFERGADFFIHDDDSLASVRFTDFLQHVRKCRNDEGGMQKAKIQNLLGSPQFPDTPPMLSTEVPNLFAEAGFCRDCCYTTEELVPIVEECNRGGGDSLGLDELVVLAWKVTEWARSVARKREAHVASSCGMDSEQVLQLRSDFAEQTKTGALGTAELKKLLKDINPAVAPPQSVLEDLIVECGPEAPMEPRESMRVMEPIMTDGSAFGLPSATPAAGSLAGSLALNLQPDKKEEAKYKVLLFEGYMRLMGRLAEEE